MKANKIIFAAALALLATSTVDARSSKRGVCENQFTFGGQISVLAPGVGWYYNWGNVPGAGYKEQISSNTELEFVPMTWSGSYSADKIKEYAATHDCFYLLGFNEPNFTNQANMTPAQAAELWPEVQKLAKEAGLKLVSPALNYSTGTYASPTKWMDEFIALVGIDAFDYIALHNYGGTGSIKTMCTEFWEKYHKPIWLTEWCLWPGGAGNVYVSPESQMASMVGSVEWLEKTDFIFRYSWFKPVGASNESNKPNYGLMTQNKENKEQFDLTQQGWTYVYMTDFNPEVYNPVNTPVAATEYISSNGLVLDKTALEGCPRPIEISKFNSGAYTDYQFDVPTAGKYNFMIECTGFGEPTRFDPSLAIESVNADGTSAQLCSPVKFTLPNDNDKYIRITFEVNLNAGRQTLRLKDSEPGRPSGIRIATVGLYDQAGVIGIEADNAAGLTPEYYTIEGRRVEHPAADGLYIVRRGNTVTKQIIRF